MPRWHLTRACSPHPRGGIRHLLVVFGGVAGLEASVDADEHLTISGEDASCLFDMWVNTCPAQGSRTIRTEVRAGSASTVDLV